MNRCNTQYVLEILVKIYWNIRMFSILQIDSFASVRDMTAWISYTFPINSVYISLDFGRNIFPSTSININIAR